MSHSAGSLERYLIRPDTWDREVPGRVRVHGIDDEGKQPVGYGRHPEDGWFVLGTGQGPFILYADWLETGGVTELTDFGEPSPPPERYREPLIAVLDRLRTTLQEQGTEP